MGLLIPGPAMDVTLDRYGRILLPKALRDRLGLQAGSRLHVETTGEGIALRPVGQDAIVTVRDGVLVYEGRLIDDGAGLLRDVREERIRRAGGLP